MSSEQGERPIDNSIGDPRPELGDARGEAKRRELDRLVDELLDGELPREKSRAMFERLCDDPRGSRELASTQRAVDALKAPVVGPDFVGSVTDELERKRGFVSEAGRRRVWAARVAAAAAVALVAGAGFMAQRSWPGLGGAGEEAPMSRLASNVSSEALAAVETAGDQVAAAPERLVDRALVGLQRVELVASAGLESEGGRVAGVAGPVVLGGRGTLGGESGVALSMRLKEAEASAGRVSGARIGTSEYGTALTLSGGSGLSRTVVVGRSFVPADVLAAKCAEPGARVVVRFDREGRRVVEVLDRGVAATEAPRAMAMAMDGLSAAEFGGWRELAPTLGLDLRFDFPDGFGPNGFGLDGGGTGGVTIPTSGGFGSGVGEDSSSRPAPIGFDWLERQRGGDRNRFER